MEEYGRWPEKVLAPCGKRAAFRRHVRRGEPVDQPCRDAENEYQRIKRQEGRDRKKLAALALIVTAGLLLTAGGCESSDERDLRLGIECNEAGGEWHHYIKRDSYGYEKLVQLCEFNNEKEEPWKTPTSKELSPIF